MPPYIGEIRMFAGNFAPAGWMMCDGAPMPISENESLFVVIGTTYGGDGEETFNLPNLQGRLPMHQGNGVIIGETGGVEEVTLTTSQIPAHSHAMLASSNNALTPIPTANVPASPTAMDTYRPVAGNTPLAPQAISPTGGSQPHTNMQPYLVINFIISLFGEFPSQT
jgi:microcystin-dependent protein